MPVRPVIFDLGGVLTTSPLPALSAFVGDAASAPAVHSWFTNPMGTWARYEVGAIEEQAVAAALESEADQLSIDIDVPGFLDAFFGAFEPRQSMLDLVANLRPVTAVGCLTNTIRRGGHAQWFGIDPSLFDAVVASCEVGMRKPDPAIYTLICRRLGVYPASVVFVDDMQVNVDAASALGMHGIVFTSVEQTISAVEGATGVRL